MSPKHQRVEALLAPFSGRARNAHFSAYLELFNRQRFYEAHDALEALWLQERHGPEGEFQKGLIQLAGAFVHVQKNRRGPARALFQLARHRLAEYPATHAGLDVSAALALVEEWLRRIESDEPLPHLLAAAPPRLERRVE